MNTPGKKKFKFPLSFNSWDKKEIKAINDVIKTNRFTMGKFVKKFENNFSKFIGSKYSVLVNSGSSANLLMVASLFYKKKNFLKKGDEVIVPALSWSTTYYPLYQYGLKIKFVDIDLITLNYDLTELSKAISYKTKVIMAVNILGNSNNFFEIKKLIKKKNIILVEDNCESLGSKLKNKFTGTFGLLGTTSCYFSHHLNTIEGGVIHTDDKELYQIILSLRAHGWTRDLPEKNLLQNKFKNSFYNQFNFILPGYNLRPIEFTGAIGVEQLKKLPKMITQRRKNAEVFKNSLKDHKDFIIQEEIGQSSWFGFSIIIKKNSSYTRDKLIKNLNNLGFECRPIVAGNFVRNKAFKYFNSEISGKLKNAEYVHKNGVYIGNSSISLENALILLKKL